MNSKDIYFFIGFFLLLFSNGISAEFESKVLLDQYLEEHGYKKMETGVFSGITNQPDFLTAIVQSNPYIHTIGEIGFNAGHSSLVFLEASPHVFVYSFDIMQHDYVPCAKEFIDKRFPSRHQLIPGDSGQSVPLFKMGKKPYIKFDLIFIDGGHGYRQALLDIENMRDLAYKDTILIIDDILFSGVQKAYEECVHRNLISEGTIERSGHKAWLVSKYIF